MKYEIWPDRALIFPTRGAGYGRKWRSKPNSKRSLVFCAANRSPDFPQKAYRRIKISHSLTAAVAPEKAWYRAGVVASPTSGLLSS
jgi:hypothetical protein